MTTLIRQTWWIKTVAVTFAAGVLLSGCVPAMKRVVVIPGRDQSVEQMAADKASCEQFAVENRNNAEALSKAGLGAAIGAGGGALLGAIGGAYGTSGAGGGAGYGAAIGGASGLLFGLIGGIAEDHQRYIRVYKLCLAHRGYSVTD